MSKSRLYARAQKRTFPQASKEPQVMNRAQTPVVENHPGHPDQKTHGRRKLGVNLPDAPDAPAERYKGPAGPTEHTGEAARRAEQSRRSGETVHPKTVRKPRRTGDEGATAPGERWAGKEQAPESPDRWKGPSGPSETESSRADEINRLTSEIRRTTDRAERTRLRKRRAELAGEAMYGTPSSTPEQRRRINKQTEEARKRLRSMPKEPAGPPQRYPGAKSWYSVRNFADTDVATVHIYNDIGGEAGGLGAQDFIRDLGAVRAKTIDLRLNSRGGDVFEGIAIHNALREHAAQVHVTVDGVAASIASVIAMAGDRITMATGAQMMIHEGYTGMIGNAADMTRAANLLNKTSDTIAAFYSRRAGGTIAQWRERMQAETWYDAAEAVQVGLADEVAPALMRTRNTWDLSVFNFAGRAHAPAPKLTTAPSAAPQDSWADIAGSLTAPSNVDSVLAALMEDL